MCFGLLFDETKVKIYTSNHFPLIGRANCRCRSNRFLIGFQRYRKSLRTSCIRHAQPRVFSATEMQQQNQDPTNPPSSKTVYFYRDGSNQGEGVRVVLHPNRFRNLEALQEFLTGKLPDLPYGVRSIYSPRGRTKIRTLTELNNDGHYIASDQRQKARGIQLSERSILLPSWRAGRPPSGQKLLSYSLKADTGFVGAPLASNQHETAANNRHARLPAKVIYVHQNGDAFHRHRMIVEKRPRGTLQFLLNELSFELREPIHKLYTLDGSEVGNLRIIVIIMDYL